MSEDSSEDDKDKSVPGHPWLLANHLASVQSAIEKSSQAGNVIYPLWAVALIDTRNDLFVDRV
jgi:hypothetical protein